ncbi:MAG: lipid-A-disaccharide synthase [Crocinitomicaceae bacterium]
MNSGKKIFVISGEASGDLHAANLIREMKLIQPDIEFIGWGGDRMRKEGVRIKKHISELAFMGFKEVILNLKTIMRNFRSCKNQISEFKPDFLILVDYPGFNLRIAKWAKKEGIPIAYYISPQIWAWKQSRIFQIKENVTKMYTILPFEPDFYRKFEVEVEYCGHPLLDEITRFNESNNNKLTSEKPILAILPGSRKQEIERKLPIMLEAAKHFPQFETVVACAPNLPLNYYLKYASNNVRFVENETYKLLNSAEMAIVTSGTATLETALFRVPQVVCYKSSRMSYLIARMLVKIKFISLVNLILEREVVRELIQKDCNSEQIVNELNLIQNDSRKREKMLNDYDQLIQLLGQNGSSKRVAEKIWFEFGSGN